MRKRTAFLIGAAVGVPMFMLAALYASVSGGWDDAFRPKKTESSREVRAARERALPRVDEYTNGLPGGFGEPVSECDQGQHNWKIDDDYDVSCVLRTTAVVTGRERELAADVRELHETLTRLGWRPRFGDGLLEGSARRVPALGTREYLRDGVVLKIAWGDAARPPRSAPDTRIEDGDYATELTVRLPYYED
jgi:hypothetical protein